MSDGLALGTKRLRSVQIAVGLLLLIVFYSVGKRFVLDMPHLAAGTVPPEDEFDYRYVEQAWLAYLHIVPGVVYLFLAPLQLAYRIRSRHYTFHRRLGRVLATAGIISGVFALIFGGLFSFGGLPEASAAVVFGLWFLTCLVLGRAGLPVGPRGARSTASSPPRVDLSHVDHQSPAIGRVLARGLSNAEIGNETHGERPSTAGRRGLRR